jgi:hypothetical protein
MPGLAALAVLAVLLTAAGFYVMRQQQTAAPRDTPMAVSRAYVEATLVTHDEHATFGLVCDVSQLALPALWWELHEIERTRNTKARLTFSGWKVAENGAQATVDFRVAIAYPGASIPNQTQDWTVSLKRSARWQVCTTRRI